MLLRRILVCKLIFIAFDAEVFLQAEKFTGTVYENQSGPSGIAAGTVRIATDKCVLDFAYQKPYLHSFQVPTCEELGALWTIEGKITHPGMATLDSATCSGSFDHAIRSAWLAVRGFLRLVAEGSFSEANAFRSSRALKSGLDGDLAKLGGLDMNDYMAYGGAGKCLGVKLKESDKEVVIQAGSDCFIRRSGNPISLSFRVVEEGVPKNWRIDKVVVFR